MPRLHPFHAAWLLVFCAALSAAAYQSATVVSTPDGAAPENQTGAADASADRRRSSESMVEIYVTSNGWHSAIVVPRAALPIGAIPEATDFPGAAYLSLGWGDAEYFPAREPTLGMKLRAALQPTPAVVHMAGLPSHPREFLPADEVVELKTTTEDFEKLVAYLDSIFDRAGAARAQASEPGLYRFSLFYRAKGEFHLFNTCNTWTARGLKAAGWPVRVSGIVTAEDLMAQIRP